MLNADAYEVLQSDRHEGIEGLGLFYRMSHGPRQTMDRYPRTIVI